MDPSEANAATTTLPEKREFVIYHPGALNWASPNGHYVGCAVKLFKDIPGKSSDELINEFFKQHANLLVVSIEPTMNGVYVIYTNTLSGEELEEHQEATRFLTQHMDEWRKNRADAHVKEEEEGKAARLEEKRLISVGENCEKHHKHNLPKRKG